MPINPDRLAGVFISLCEQDSLSTKEGKVSRSLKAIFSGLGADEIIEDDSGGKTGSDTGNLIIRFRGGMERMPVFFTAHMDTVTPGEGVTVKRVGNIFSSGGNTILGGDDKSGIAVLIETMQALREDGVTHGPVEFVFTTCEETGLLGAKAFDPRMLKAGIGYALDMDSTEHVITRAPAANRLVVEITGAAAHAGLNPEKGINAILLAAKALAGLRIGRIDKESTSNFGVIEGGKATNIVPDHVRLEGEVRSHDEEKLKAYTAEIEKAFRNTVEGWVDPTGFAEGRPTLSFKVSKEYPAMKLDEECPVITLVRKAAERIGRKMECISTGGGSDANIFNGYGLETAIIGTGMRNVHTTDEFIKLDDMVKTAELIKSILTTG